MNLRTLLKKAGGTALKIAFPGASGVVDLVSDAIGHKLTGDETGADIESMGLSDEILGKEIDLKIVESNNYAEVAIAQEQNNNSTRPEIAKLMAYFVCGMGILSILLLVISMSIDAYTSKGPTDLTDVLSSNLHWIIGAFIVPAIGIIQQYFARRSDDKRNAHSAASRMPLPPSAGFISKALGLLK